MMNINMQIFPVEVPSSSFSENDLQKYFFSIKVDIVIITIMPTVILCLEIRYWHIFVKCYSNNLYFSGMLFVIIFCMFY